jgi:hypothetical protein
MANQFTNSGVWAHNCGIPPAVDGPGGGNPLIWSLSGLLFPNGGSGADDHTLNFEDESILNLIDNVQSVYIDNRSPTTITLRAATGPSYRIDAKSKTQGWYILPTRKGNLIGISAGAIISDPTLVNIAFANVLLYGTQYATA